MKTGPLLVFALAVVTFGACVSPSSMGTQGGACFEGGKCLEGLTCGSGNVCVPNVGEPRDAGVDVGEPSFDGAQDSGGETDGASAPDSGDAGTDAGIDAGPDGGFDGGMDGGFDAGVEFVIQTGGFVGGAGVCENTEYNLNYSVEWNAVTVMESDEYRLTGGAVVR